VLITREQALAYHAEGRPGKIKVTPTKSTVTQEDLSLAYSPGVAEPCREIARNPEDVFRYTARGNLVAVVTNGTAVLGLGNIGPLAAKPVMEGKSVLFKRFADIDCFDIELDAPEVPATETAMRFDGEDDHLAVPDRAIDLPDGPLTLECWFNADSFGDRTGLVAKTENSDYGFFVSEGNPGFYVHIGGSYLHLEAGEGSLETGRWYHIAGVYDGSEARLYLDGALLARETRSGSRRTNRYPLIVGGDVSGRGELMSPFEGMIDAVRLSSTARYTGGTFSPDRRPASDGDTVLLLNMDGFVGPWTYDESPSQAHPLVEGEPALVRAEN